MTRIGATGLFSAGLLVGVLAVIIVQQSGQPDRSPAVAGDPAANAVSAESAGLESADEIAELRHRYGQQLSALSAENEALQADNQTLQAKVKNFEDALARFRMDDPKLAGRKAGPPEPFDYEEERNRFRATARQNDAANLLAAGYSRDRIEYLQKRAEELAAQFRQTRTDGINKGLGLIDPETDLGLTLDPYFALKGEIGDSEYERFLAALKRPTTVGVAEVLQGSGADSAGLKPGDEIVAYNNKRVFNSGQLDGMSWLKATDRAGEQVPITVRRDGQMIQMRVPKGPLGIRPPLPGIRGVALPPDVR